KGILVMVLLTMLFGAGLIPNFILVRELGLLNSYWALILPVLISPFNMVVMRAFFMGLPQELLESARIDGASALRVFLPMVLPLSKGVIAVVALSYAVGYWSVFFYAMIYIQDTEKWPIQVVLNQYVVQNSDLAQVTNPDKPPPPSATVQNAVIVLATVPILCVYPFVQKYFTKGVLTGAIRGRCRLGGPARVSARPGAAPRCLRAGPAGRPGQSPPPVGPARAVSRSRPARLVCPVRRMGPPRRLGGPELRGLGGEHARAARQAPGPAQPDLHRDRDQRRDRCEQRDQGHPPSPAQGDRGDDGHAHVDHERPAVQPAEQPHPGFGGAGDVLQEHAHQQTDPGERLEEGDRGEQASDRRHRGLGRRRRLRAGGIGVAGRRGGHGSAAPGDRAVRAGWLGTAMPLIVPDPAP